MFKDTYKIYADGEKVVSGSWSENPNVSKNKRVNRKCYNYGSINNTIIRGTVRSKAPLRVQFSPALGGIGGGKGLKPKLLLGFTK